MVNSSAADAELKARFPCRERSIDALATAVQTGQAGACTLLLHGPPSTGKTAIVRACMSAWGMRHAFIDCVACSTPRPLLQSLLHQLKGGARKRGTGYAQDQDCDSLAELLVLLPALFRGHGRAPPQRGAWVVLDNAQRLAGSDLLTGLTRAGAAADVPLSVLLLARQPWSSTAFATSTQALAPPATLEWAAYSSDQMIQILEHRRRATLPAGAAPSGDAATFRAFLTAFVPTYRRATTDLLEVEAAVAALYPAFRAPLDAGRELRPAQLHARVNPLVQRVVAERSHTAAPAAKEFGSGVPCMGAAHDATPGSSSGAPPALASQLPFVSKYLILAAYVASRNKPTADRAVFDPGFRKKARRGAQAHDRMVEAAEEAWLRGPHPFPLERCLHIFYALYSSHEGEEVGEGGAWHDPGAEGGVEDWSDANVTRDCLGQGRRSPGSQPRGGDCGGVDRAATYPPEVLHADVLMALSSLVMLRMLSMSGGDPLEPGTLYRCGVEEGVVRAIAANLKVQLSDYLKLA